MEAWRAGVGAPGVGVRQSGLGYGLPWASWVLSSAAGLAAFVGLVQGLLGDTGAWRRWRRKAARDMTPNRLTVLDLLAGWGFVLALASCAERFARCSGARWIGSRLALDLVRWGRVASSDPRTLRVLPRGGEGVELVWPPGNDCSMLCIPATRACRRRPPSDQLPRPQCPH